jgi:hypothetical protein
MRSTRQGERGRPALSAAVRIRTTSTAPLLRGERRNFSRPVFLLSSSAGRQGAGAGGGRVGVPDGGNKK